MMISRADTRLHLDNIRSQERVFIASHLAEIAHIADVFPNAESQIIDYVGNADEPQAAGFSGWPRAGINIANSILHYVDQGDRTNTPYDQERGSVFSDTVLPLAGIEPPRKNPTYATHGRTAHTYCDAAERYFAGARKHYVPATSMRSKISVYHNPDGKPVAFRKSFESSTALTLEPMEVEGIALPPGTIIGIGRKKLKATGRYILSRDLRTYEVGDGFAISPKRLSAWAYPEVMDRAVFAGDSFLRRIIVTKLGLDDFKDTAQRIMELCRVDS